MASVFRLKNAEEVRETTTMKQQKEILRLYRQLYRDVSKKVASMGKENIRKQNLVLLQREIKNRIRSLNQDIQNNIIRDIRTVSSTVVEDMRTFLKRCGFKDEDIHNAFEYIPDQIVRNISIGNIYQDGWTLSNAIWGYSQKVQENINQIVSIGTAQGKTTYEIAQELERYVEPGARKQSHTISSWRKATINDVRAGRADYVGQKIQDKFYFGRVDYNAQRLARTLISHAYQQSLINTNQNDPFVTGFRWLTSNFHGRVCDICRERADTDQFGLGRGVFPKDQLPLDHPNGMCTFEMVMTESMDEIAERIGKWYQAPTGTYPEIDRYVLDFMR